MSSDEQSRPLPRLTGTLRAFSRVSPRYDEFSLHAERNLMKKRREKNQALRSSGDQPHSVGVGIERTWSNLVDTLVVDKNNAKFAKLKSLLDKLRMNMSKQLLNEDFNDASLLNEASLFILESFYDHRNKSSTVGSRFEALDKLNKKLKEKFGQFQKNLFDQCRDLMEAIFNEIETLDRFTPLHEFFKSRNVVTDIYSFDETSVSLELFIFCYKHSLTWKNKFI